MRKQIKVPARPWTYFFAPIGPFLDWGKNIPAGLACKKCNKGMSCTQLVPYCKARNSPSQSAARSIFIYFLLLGLGAEKNEYTCFLCYFFSSPPNHAEKASSPVAFIRQHMNTSTLLFFWDFDICILIGQALFSRIFCVTQGLYKFRKLLQICIHSFQIFKENKRNSGIRSIPDYIRRFKGVGINRARKKEH
jgi:hypothetical protein